MFESIHLPTVLISYVALLFSLSVHEAAHAGAAYLLDDDTAARQGRLTLNPVAHIDVLGTILLPLAGLLFGGFFIGWAKPVPFNPARLTRRLRIKVSSALISFAGPASNLALALLFLVVTSAAIRLMTPSTGLDLALMHRDLMSRAAFAGPEALMALDLPSWQVLVLGLGGRLVQLNVLLAFFNLIPLGPLDGAGVLGGFIPDEHSYRYQRLRYHPGSMVALLLLMFLSIGGIPLISFVLNPVLSLVYQGLRPIAQLILGA